MLFRVYFQNTKTFFDIHYLIKSLQQEDNIMKRIPKRDITGKCRLGCRDRIREGEHDRQLDIEAYPYSEPLSRSPEWVKNRKEQPGVFGGRV